MFALAVKQYLERHGFESINLKAVLFDMDGVLYDSMPNHAVAWQESMAKFGIKMTADDAYATEGARGVDTIRMMVMKQQGREIDEAEAQIMYDEKSRIFHEMPEAPIMPGIIDLMRQIKSDGIQIGIVTGGGNFWRGRTGNEIERTKADQIGMLATVMNCIYVSEIFRTEGMDTVVFTPFSCGDMSVIYSKDAVTQAFSEGKVVFFAGGTGHPYFSTDTTTVLRALEIEADRILLAKSIDGVYDSDPASDPNAKKFDSISIDEVYERKLQVVDLTATALCLENRMPLTVFSMNETDSILNAIKGRVDGTEVTV